MTVMTEMTLGDIASRYPGATAIFRSHRLDFCCGGGETLAHAAAARGLDAIALERSLLSLARHAPMPAPVDPVALIDHILDRYHAVHRREFPELIRLAQKVEAVHRDHKKVPAGLAVLLETMHGELETHMQKEEDLLFPMIRAGGNAMVVYPISVLREDHDHHGEQLRRIESLTGDLVIPEGACPTWKALYAGLGKLIDDLMEHIHLENNLLFPKVSDRPFLSARQ
ncbi:iron-sulfur cluster repair protein YtfE [Govanella unica]|uniref:Iron-sulfur cluster repair protein YtfE n=1 Tax=Govanella unica TaxID=2975056 RepID=A0A9X3Z7B6_9PROT|nr:iron-sulfur cluster repair protein YtfE [Govania unica]MDA5194070.1 iron-sulfur cluster repair protein YtfE [Govania unica]